MIDESEMATFLRKPRPGESLLHLAPSAGTIRVEPGPWLTPRRAALAAVAVVIFVMGYGWGVVATRRAVAVEAEVRASR